MYVEVIPNRSSPPAILLRESYRDGNKIRKRTLANLSSWPAAKIEALRRVLRNDPVAPMDLQRLRVVRSFRMAMSRRRWVFWVSSGSIVSSPRVAGSRHAKWR